MSAAPGLAAWRKEAAQVEEALKALHLVLVDARLFPARHPKLRASYRSAFEATQRMLAALGEVELKRIGNELIYRDFALQGRLQSTDEFCARLRECTIECLVLKPGMTPDELEAFIGYFRLTESRRREAPEAGRYLRECGVTHIEVWRLAGPRGAAGVRRPAAGAALARTGEQQMLGIASILGDAKSGNGIDLGSVETVVDRLLLESSSRSASVVGLSNLQSVDEYTATHSLHVCMLSMAVGRYLGLEANLLRALGVAALLHDVGKMFVPDAVLNKHGRLTDEEWQVMRQHPLLGARFLMCVPGMPDLAPVVAFEHHLTHDETGYPEVPASYNPSLASRIVSVVDFYDALTTDRPYKRAVAPWRAIELLEQEGDARTDPRLRRVFIQLVGRYPVGSLVELDSGELAVVSRQNDGAPDRPEVCLVRDSAGHRLPLHFPVNLVETNSRGEPLHTIVRAVEPADTDSAPAALLAEIFDTGADGRGVELVVTRNR